MRAVNLLPKEIQRASAQKPVGPVLIGAVALLLCGAVLYKSRADNDAKIAQREADIAAIVKVPAKHLPNVTEGQRAAAAQEAPRITAIDSALKNRVPWDNVLRQVSLVVPEDVTLQTLALSAPVAADSTSVRSASNKDAGVTLVGSSYSQDGVARFLARLEVVPALANVQLTQSAQTDTTAAAPTGGEAPPAIVNFTITADIVTPGVVS
jgi:Tfp pilus assembly protein PilN